MDAVMGFFTVTYRRSFSLARITGGEAGSGDEQGAESDSLKWLDLFTNYQERSSEKQEGLRPFQEKASGGYNFRQEEMEECHAKGMNLEEGATTISKGTIRLEDTRHSDNRCGS